MTHIAKIKIRIKQNRQKINNREKKKVIPTPNHKGTRKEKRKKKEKSTQSQRNKKGIRKEKEKTKNR